MRAPESVLIILPSVIPIESPHLMRVRGSPEIIRTWRSILPDGWWRDISGRRVIIRVIVGIELGLSPVYEKMPGSEGHQTDHQQFFHFFIHGGDYLQRGTPVKERWCERGDSNPQGLPRRILSPVRLPNSATLAIGAIPD